MKSLHIRTDQDGHLWSGLHGLFTNCEPDEELDFLAREAATLLRVPIAMVNFVGTHKVYFKACAGQKRGETLDRRDAFCSATVQNDKVYVVPNALEDNDFKFSPLVTGPMHIRSYAGWAIRAGNGERVGTFCVLDTKVRNFSRHELEILRDLAEQAEEHMAAYLSVLA